MTALLWLSKRRISYLDLVGILWIAREIGNGQVLWLLALVPLMLASAALGLWLERLHS